MSDLIRIQALEDAARDHSSLFLQLQRVPTCQTKKKPNIRINVNFFTYLYIYKYPASISLSSETLIYS